MRYPSPIILILLLFAFSGAGAQQVSQVVEKVVQWDRELKDVNTLDLHSEKAEVFISRGEPGKISIKMIFTASHPDRSIAEAEMRFHHYVVGPKDGTWFIYQGYMFRNVTQVLSKLTARVEITIPPDMSVTGVGEYSDFTVGNGDGTNNFRLHFGKLVLNNVNGTTRVYSNYADIEINRCAGKINVEARRSDIVLKAIHPVAKKTTGKEEVVDAGNLYIRNTLGTIEIENSTP